jgi:hypothetical protein
MTGVAIATPVVAFIATLADAVESKAKVIPGRGETYWSEALI